MTTTPAFCEPRARGCPGRRQIDVQQTKSTHVRQQASALLGPVTSSPAPPGGEARRNIASSTSIDPAKEFSMSCSCQSFTAGLRKIDYF
jgi:hypothetical protein